MTKYFDVIHTGYDLYKCERCGAIFESPEVATKKLHYTVGDNDGYVYSEEEVCPECGSSHIDSYEKEEEE